MQGSNCKFSNIKDCKLYISQTRGTNIILLNLRRGEYKYNLIIKKVTICKTRGTNIILLNLRRGEYKYNLAVKKVTILCVYQRNGFEVDIQNIPL